MKLESAAIVLTHSIDQSECALLGQNLHGRTGTVGRHGSASKKWYCQRTGRHLRKERRRPSYSEGQVALGDQFTKPVFFFIVLDIVISYRLNNFYLHLVMGLRFNVDIYIIFMSNQGASRGGLQP